jgi:hypothetical protein
MTSSSSPNQPMRLCSSSVTTSITTVTTAIVSNRSTRINRHRWPLCLRPPSRHATPTAYQGIAQEPFSKEATDVLLGEIDPADVEIKPDGTVYMPEIKYRRRLNHAFGPGAWAMKPVGSAVLTEDLLSRTYQLFWYAYTAFLQPFHFFRFFFFTHNASCRTNTAWVDSSPKQLASSACVMA